eukprot:6269875-Amphidinium_carterae.1
MRKCSRASDSGRSTLRCVVREMKVKLAVCTPLVHSVWQTHLRLGALSSRLLVCVIDRVHRIQEVIEEGQHKKDNASAFQVIEIRYHNKKRVLLQRDSETAGMLIEGTTETPRLKSLSRN